MLAVAAGGARGDARDLAVWLDGHLHVAVKATAALGDEHLLGPAELVDEDGDPVDDLRRLADAGAGWARAARLHIRRSSWRLRRRVAKARLVNRRVVTVRTAP